MIEVQKTFTKEIEVRNICKNTDLMQGKELLNLQKYIVVSLAVQRLSIRYFDYSASSSVNPAIITKMWRTWERNESTYF